MFMKIYNTKVKIFGVFLTGLLSLILLTHCGDNIDFYGLNNDPSHSDSKECHPIIINESLYNIATSDAFIINDAYIADDRLVVKVQYGGGCGNTTFKLLTNGYFMESNPVQLNILLSFIDEDPCEALIQTHRCFDLTELADHYKDGYQTQQGKIILHLKDYDEDLEYIF
jgi:hypothetical protein